LSNGGSRFPAVLEGFALELAEIAQFTMNSRFGGASKIANEVVRRASAAHLG
jgi:hypothetical protein